MSTKQFENGIKVVDTLTQTIILCVKHFIKEASFDKTTQGRIVDFLEANNYMVELNGVKYSIPCSTG